MKVCLVSIVIGEKYLDEYNKLFRDSQENYAKKNEYDFKVITDYLDKNFRFPQAITFHKLLLCSQDWSNEYDFIIYVDADIFININSPPIHSYIDYGDKVGVIDEYSQPSKSERLLIQQKMRWEKNATEYYKLCNFNLKTDMVLNSGLLVFQPKFHKDFLENIYNKYVKISLVHKRKYHWEQSCIGYELQINNKYIILDNKYNTIWPLYKFYKKRLEDLFKDSYFIHFAGHIDFNRVNEIEKLNYQ